MGTLQANLKKEEKQTNSFQQLKLTFKDCGRELKIISRRMGYDLTRPSQDRSPETPSSNLPRANNLEATTPRNSIGAEVWLQGYCDGTHMLHVADCR